MKMNAQAPGVNEFAAADLPRLLMHFRLNPSWRCLYRFGDGVVAGPGWSRFRDHVRRWKKHGNPVIVLRHTVLRAACKKHKAGGDAPSRLDLFSLLVVAPG